MHVHVHVLHVPHVASATEINGKECVWGNHQVNVYKLWPGLMDGVSQSPVVPCPPPLLMAANMSMPILGSGSLGRYV